MQEECKGLLPESENKNAGHDSYTEVCMSAKPITSWHENLHSYQKRIYYFYFGERNTKKTRNSQSPSFNNRKYLYATYYFDNVSSFITRSVLTSTKYIIFHVTNLTMGKAGIEAFLIPSRRAYNFSVVRHQTDSYLGKAHLQKENNTKKDSKN